MKNLISVFFVASLFLSFPATAFGKASGGGVHHINKEKYDCSLVSKPGKINWIKKAKKDIIGDGIIILTWDDAFRAHQVYIYMKREGGPWVKSKAEDDGREKKNGLVKGAEYMFKVQGVSNCGKGKMSKTVKISS